MPFESLVTLSLVKFGDADGEDDSAQSGTAPVEVSFVSLVLLGVADGA